MYVSNNRGVKWLMSFVKMFAQISLGNASKSVRNEL